GARPAGEVLDLVGLSARTRVRVKQLSGGEKRRLDLALALTSRREVLFLDEPTPGLEASVDRCSNGGGFAALSGISFSVARGEVFSLLGTNGAGKTSTVELLEGL
ncbi:ATP-binding cassette domain-containing protein, partial [Streptomyces sp. BE308]|uniref:ATP-binding cassette domain-containing protein n=1 Tax=Streptomyces sp. BE308 TaxID=3002529 RepID=UPI002E7A6793